LETNIGEDMSEVVVEKKPVVMSTSRADEFFKNFPKDKNSIGILRRFLAKLSRSNILKRQRIKRVESV